MTGKDRLDPRTADAGAGAIRASPGRGAAPCSAHRLRSAAQVHRVKGV